MEDIKILDTPEKKVYLATIALLILALSLNFYTQHAQERAEVCMVGDVNPCPITVDRASPLYGQYNWWCLENNGSNSFCLVNNRSEATQFVTFYQKNSSSGIGNLGNFNKTDPAFFQSLDELNLTDVWQYYRDTLDRRERLAAQKGLYS